MDTWAKKTARLAQSGDYLDRLQAIYPVVPKARVVADHAIRSIHEAFRKRDRVALLKILLGLERFPYDESYAKYLRADPGAMARNPRTVHRICDMLFDMGVEKVVAGITAPKEANTRRGHEFKRWIEGRSRFVGAASFRSSSRGIVFLDAPDTELRDFANATLGAGLSKRPDFIARVGKRYIIGEAKFLSDEGGNQRAAFRDAMAVAAHPTGMAVKVAVVDGIVWIKGSSFYRTIEASSVHIFTALLLHDFLGSLSAR